MRRAERVVHVKITERGERLGESRVVPFLAGPEAGVLDERDAAPGQAPGRGDPRRGVGDELDRGAEDPLDVAHDALERQRWIRAVGTTEVREQDHARPFVAQVLDGRCSGADACVVRHPAFLQGDVEVHAHEGALAVQRFGREVAQAALSHLPPM